MPRNDASQLDAHVTALEAMADGQIIGDVQRDLSVSDLAHYFMGGTVELSRPRHISNAYKQVSVVNACVRKKADAMAQLPLRISTTDDNVVESGPLVELADKPNPRMTGRAFWRATSAFLDLFGCVYWLRLHADLRGGVSGILPVSHLQLKPRRNTQGETIAYEYRPFKRGNVMELIPVEDVHEIIEPDYGSGYSDEALSLRQAAGMAAEQFFKADLANLSSLDNDMSPSGYLKAEEDLTEEQEQQIKAMLRDSNIGTHNRRRLLILTGNLSWESIANKFNEMEFAQLKQMSRDDICAVFGTPALVIGYEGQAGLGKGGESDNALMMFWGDTIRSRAEWLAEEWDHAVVKLMSQTKGTRALRLASAKRRAMVRRECVSLGRRECAMRANASGMAYYAWFDFSQVPVIVDMQLQRSKEAVKLTEVGIPLADINDAYDLPFEVREWQKTWWKPINLVNVEEAMMPGDDDTPGPPESTPESPPVSPSQEGPNQNPPADDGDQGKGIHPRTKSAIEQIYTKNAPAMWMQFRASWDPHQRLVMSRTERFVFGKGGLVAQVIANIKRAYKTGRLAGLTTAQIKAFTNQQIKDVIGEMLFDVNAAVQQYIKLNKPVLQDVLQLGGDQSMDEAAAASGADTPDAFDIASDEAQAALRRRTISISQVPRRTQRKLRQMMSEALSEGVGQEELIERTRQFFKADMSVARRRLIAFQEVGTAIEEGRAEGRRQAGVPYKRWLWSRKEKGRQNHQLTEDATAKNPVPNDANFVIAVTMVECPHPRGSGRASEDINCGCTAISSYGDEAKDTAMVNHLMTKGMLMTGGQRTIQLTAQQREQAGASDPEFTTETPGAQRAQSDE